MFPVRNASRGAARHLVRGVAGAIVVGAMMAALAGQARAQSADLVVNQSDAPDPGPAGGVFTYTIRVDNNGPDTAVGVTLGDTLPPGSTFVGVATTQGSCAQSAGTVTCALGDLAFLDSATATIQVRLPTAGVWTNTATASSSTPDPNGSNNVGLTEGTTAQAAANMSLTATDAPDPVAAGQNLNYTLTARNNGPNALGATDTQTIAFTIAANTCLRGVPTGTGWSCTPSTGYPRCGGTVGCTRTGALAVNANAPALTVPAVANLGGSVTSAFAVSSSLPDGDAANNTATATTTVTGGSSNVSITKTASPATVAVGSNVTYTITPRHNGGEPPGTLAPNLVTVTDTFNAALTFVSATGTGWTCSFAAPTLTCTLPGPYTGGNFTNMPPISVVATVGATGAIANTATVSAPETDPVPANNSSTVNITGSSTSNLQLTKTASVNPVALNGTFNFTLTVRNLGPVAVPATNTITVTDTLPAGVSLTAQPSGSGWTCTPSAGFPLAGPVAISCSRPGPLGVNANAPNITLPSRATSAGTVTNAACVALSGSGTNDPTPANDCAAVAVNVTATQADLQVVSKTATPNPVLVGHDLAYLITVRNNSVDAATNVTVVDTLNSLVTTDGFQSATPSQGTCTPSTVTPGPSVALSCNLGTMNGGTTATITVVVRPLRATTGARGNSARVSSDVGDPVPGNNEREVSSTVTAVADLSVSKTGTPTPVQAGTPLTYVVTARNNGLSTASNVVITDPLPPSTAFVGLTSVSGGGTCTVPAVGATSGTVACLWTSMAASTQQTVTFVVQPQAALAGATADNTVTIASATVDENPSNDTFSLSTPVTGALIDLIVNKVDSVDPVALGEMTSYTVTVTNGGPSQAANVVLSDVFPAGSPTATFSYQGALTLTPPGIGSCVEPPLSATAGTLACTFPTLAAGQSAIVSYAMRAESIASGLNGTTFNDASVTGSGVETQPSNNQTVHATTARRAADLAIVKSAPATFTPGAAFPWTLTVTNHGPNASTGAIVSDTLPAGVAFQSASAGCAFAAGTVTCTLATLGAGASTAIVVNVLPSSPYTGANPLANTASVAPQNEVDPVPGNNASTATSVAGSAMSDLSIVKTGPASVLAGAPVQWQLVIANAGPSVADGATFSDVLPAGVTGVSASCGSPVGGAVCGPVVSAGSGVNGSVTTMPSGGAVTITINATVTGPGPLVNTASVGVPPGGGDPQPGNNTSTTTTLVTPLSDLVIAKSASGPFMQGQVGASYALVVSNAGAGPSIGTVSVGDTLPAGLTATGFAGAGWSCTLAPLACNRNDVLAPGASYPPITLTVDVAANASAAVVNLATVSGGGESNTGNNTATVTTPVTPLLPDLTLAKIAGGTFAQGQVGATYTLTVANVGAASTSGTVSVTDTLPAGLSATAIAGPGWTCALVPLGCTRGDALAAGASYPPVTLTVNVAANAPASVVNVALVGGGGETNTTNNAATATTPVAALQPDLAVAKFAGSAFVRGGPGAGYTIGVTNSGGAPTSGLVSVIDTLPAYLTARSIGGSGWSCTLATLVCTRSDPLAPGASYPPIALVVDVAANAPSTIVNIASVSAAGDPNPANDTSTATTIVQVGAQAAQSIPGPSRPALAVLALLVAAASWLSLRGRRTGRRRTGRLL